MAVTKFEYEVLSNSTDVFIGTLEPIMKSLKDKKDIIETLGNNSGSNRLKASSESLIGLFDGMYESFESLIERFTQLIDYAKRLDEGIN